MKVTADTITKIQLALTRKGLKQVDLAKKLAWHRGNVSRLLKGGIETITEDNVDIINDYLGTDLQPLRIAEGSISPAALALSRLAERDPEISVLLDTLHGLAIREIAPFLPQVDTKKLPKLGAKITEIVHKLEQGDDPHYSRIAVEVLDLLRTFYSKEKSK